MLIVAHRAQTPGASENARSAIRLASASGANMIELDIRLSLDRQPVVFHDAFLRRAARGRGWIRAWPGFALGRIPLRDSTEGDRVASLKTILREFPAGIQGALHLKDRAALPAVLNLVARDGQPGRTWLWLEHPADVYTATRCLPELRVTLLRPWGWDPIHRPGYFAEAQWCGASGVSVPWGTIDRDLVDHAHRHQLKVFSRMERLEDVAAHVRVGLDGIITTDPAAVAGQLTGQFPSGPA